MRPIHVVSVAALCVLLALPSLADPDNKSHGRGGGPPPQAQGGGRGSDTTIVVSDRDRTTIYSYYRTEYSAGNCPPGLAKKNNGCLPPGQAKKMWAVGQPLPGTVIYEPLPPALVVRLSPPPAGYQYVRVASDVLMLAVGTRMVAAALADLTRF